MEGSPRRAARRARILPLLIAALTLFVLTPSSALAIGQILDIHEGLPDVDNRAGNLAATAGQLSRVSALGATARFNEFGSVQMLSKPGGYLATGLAADPEQAARQFISNNAVLFRLDAAGVSNLELVTAGKLSGKSSGNAVTFRQKFGTLPALIDGLITIGVNGGKVFSASSRAAPYAVPAAPSISVQQAWVAAAQDAGLNVTIAQITGAQTVNGWTNLKVNGFAEPQRVRLGAAPTPTSVLPAYEVLVVSGAVGKTGQVQPHGAYRTIIDARSGAVLVRLNILEQAAEATADTSAVQASFAAFTGTLAAADGACASKHGPYAAPANTKSIDVVASADNPLNDIVLRLYRGTTIVQAADTLFSPEAIHYAPTGGVPAGNYFVEVCNYPSAGSPLPPTTYRGTITMNDVAATDVPYPPKWKVFPANPPLGNQSFPYAMPSTDTRKVWCWESTVAGNPVAGCDEEVKNLASRAPWDVIVSTGAPTFLTKGNNADSAESWISPLTFGPFHFQTFDAGREYFNADVDDTWDNTWFTSGCSPTSFVWPFEPDLQSAVTNLFAMHNRMHDWSYFLGFTEQNWNMQDNNFGNPTLPNDALRGEAQAGALTGGYPGFVGRDNANMITLPDGVPPLTNMYLWQPIAGGFYAPCVDGDYDMAVIGHEYTHAIENRMIGKGGTRTGPQAGAMGESVSDFTGAEYLNEFSYVPVNSENPFAVGAYVTGNHQRGIRNFNMSWAYAGQAPNPGVAPRINPLNFSDIGYDVGGVQVHADGEIWSKVQYDIRQALVQKFNASFPASNAALQRSCAIGALADLPERCPGNRRWIQLYFDAMLLMPVAPSMLDARDAMIQADVNRFGGANGWLLWNQFAQHGFGENAVSTNSSGDPVPSFESPTQTNEATVTFHLVTPTGGGNFQNIADAEVFAGWYEANVTPIADTDPTTAPPGNTAKFVPGTYEFISRADGYGHTRFRLTLAAGQTRNVYVTMVSNVASSSKGATVVDSPVCGGEPFLIDDTEEQNMACLNVPGGAINVSKPGLVVDLAGTQPVKVGRVQVSTMLRAANANMGHDPAGQNRFTALRQFEIWTCTAAAANSNCTAPPLGYTKRLTSAPNAFPSVAPRPVSPELIIRNFQLPAAVDATHLQLVVLNNQCTGGPDFQGEQDNDLVNFTDCDTASASYNDVRIAELQAFHGFSNAAAAPQDPVVAMTKTGPATAYPTQTVQYTLSYTNAGPATASTAKIVDKLPAELVFVAASNGGTYNAANHSVTWQVGDVPVGGSGSVTLTGRVGWQTVAGTVMVNHAEFFAPLTLSPPTATWATLVVPKP